MQHTAEKKAFARLKNRAISLVDQAKISPGRRRRIKDSLTPKELRAAIRDILVKEKIAAHQRKSLESIQDESHTLN